MMFDMMRLFRRGTMVKLIKMIEENYKSKSRLLPDSFFIIYH